MNRVCVVVLAVATLAGTIGIALGIDMSAHAIHCGDILGPRGHFQLQQDLDCSAVPPPLNQMTALTIQDGATLDLNGHIVTCGSQNIRCVVLTGTGTQLLDGVIRGGFASALWIDGKGGHTVKNVTTLIGEDQIVVLSDNNRLVNVMAFAANAFVISGNNNRITDSIAECGPSPVGLPCIVVRGDENRLVDNFVTTPDGFQIGLSIEGNNNVVEKNRAILNRGGLVTGGGGIVVTGMGNDITNNTAFFNTPVDLQDKNGDCAHNKWKSNTFGTRDPACIQ